MKFAQFFYTVPTLYDPEYPSGQFETVNFPWSLSLKCSVAVLVVSRKTVLHCSFPVFVLYTIEQMCFYTLYFYGTYIFVCL